MRPQPHKDKSLLRDLITGTKVKLKRLPITIPRHLKVKLPKPKLTCTFCGASGAKPLPPEAQVVLGVVILNKDAFPEGVPQELRKPNGCKFCSDAVMDVKNLLGQLGDRIGCLRTVVRMRYPVEVERTDGTSSSTLPLSRPPVLAPSHPEPEAVVAKSVSPECLEDLEISIDYSDITRVQQVISKLNALEDKGQSATTGDGNQTVGRWEWCFSSLKWLPNNMQPTSFIGGVPYVCPYCNKTFFNPNQVWIHAKIAHRVPDDNQQPRPPEALSPSENEAEIQTNHTRQEGTTLCLVSKCRQRLKDSEFSTHLATHKDEECRPCFACKIEVPLGVWKEHLQLFHHMSNSLYCR